MELNFDNRVFDKLSESLDTVFPEILDVFLKETEISIDELKVKIENNQIDEIHDIAHKIKSSTKTFGASGLVEILEQIESSESAYDIQNLYQSFTNEYQSVKKHILEK